MKHYRTFTWMLVFSIFVFLPLEELKSQENSRAITYEIKWRRASTFHSNAPVFLISDSSHEFFKQESRYVSSLQFLLHKPVSSKFSIGGSMTLNSYRFASFYETELPGQHTRVQTYQSNYFGFGLSGKYAIKVAKNLNLQLINLYEIDIQAQAENSGITRISGELTAQLQFDLWKKFKPFVGTFHRRALTNYSKTEKYFPYSTGILLGIQF